MLVLIFVDVLEIPKFNSHNEFLLIFIILVVLQLVFVSNHHPPLYTPSLKC